MSTCPTDAPDTDLWLKLFDVAPDGTAWNLMSPGLDVLRASYRDGGPERKLLEPGRVYALSFENLLTGNLFEKGHRLRLVVASTFFPHYSRNLHTGELETDVGDRAQGRGTDPPRPRAPVVPDPDRGALSGLLKRPRATVLVPAALGLAVALAPFTLDPAEGPGLPGFTAAGARVEREAEARLVSLLQAETLDGFHAELTGYPHIAGTEESRGVAEAIRRRLESFGLETETRRYEAYLSYPKRIAVRRTAPSRLELRVDEPADPGDPATAHPGLAPGFVAYSASGRVEGEVVYANYGLPGDYDALEALGVSARGRIALVRYGKVHRAVKVATAFARGARGILIYSDPADDGFVKGDVLPKGPWRGPELLQRGNAKQSWFFHGDPLTPGRPALAEAERLRPEDSPALPRIPAAVLSWKAARPLLEGLAGKAPEGFAGGLDLSYGTGPGPCAQSWTSRWRRACARSST